MRDIHPVCDLSFWTKTTYSVACVFDYFCENMYLSNLQSCTQSKHFDYLIKAALFLSLEAKILREEAMRARMYAQMHTDVILYAQATPLLQSSLDVVVIVMTPVYRGPGKCPEMALSER